MIEVKKFNRIKVCGTWLTLTQATELAEKLSLVCSEIKYWINQYEIWHDVNKSLIQPLDNRFYWEHSDLNGFLVNRKIENLTTYVKSLNHTFASKVEIYKEKPAFCLFAISDNYYSLLEFEQQIKKQLIYPSLIDVNEILYFIPSQKLDEFKNYLI